MSSASEGEQVVDPRDNEPEAAPPTPPSDPATAANADVPQPDEQACPDLFARTGQRVYVKGLDCDEAFAGLLSIFDSSSPRSLDLECTGFQNGALWCWEGRAQTNEELLLAPHARAVDVGGSPTPGT